MKKENKSKDRIKPLEKSIEPEKQISISPFSEPKKDVRIVGDSYPRKNRKETDE